MSRPDLLTRLHNREYREAFISSTINSTVAYQIRGLRKLHDLDQAELGNLAGMKQTAISRLENPDYGNLSVNTLKRIAKAFDVGLIVRFAPFSEILRWRFSMNQRDMAPPAFSMDAGLDTGAFSGHTHFIGNTNVRSRTHASQISHGSTAQQLVLQFDSRMPIVEGFLEQTATNLARVA
jgi:DNA-binding XRE family transcriptional regulator